MIRSSVGHFVGQLLVVYELRLRLPLRTGRLFG